jgi:adenylylsulfate kinase-like enzyme
MARDPKGIYRTATNVPGLQVEYEPPESPDMVVECEQEPPDDAARRLVALLKERGLV